MTYEDRMQIVFDTVSKMAVVIFREKLTFHGSFTTRNAAYQAGEDHCRLMGWDDAQRAKVS
ncbi:hypothetical protein [Xylophilus sp.]|uniref:hypothetical protein n=1 Tax=Xylophilus sp. TaxID=2653893 RepID=UPI0013B89221|nr:hypothetical protein [Xylophilus sp.]KAF1042565.1 MAG: hypothetical protein GAK38_04280 [Xylophilus sp.]